MSASYNQTVFRSKRLLSALRWEVVLQFRNGFYYATGFILAFWLLLYTQMGQLQALTRSVDLNAVLPGVLVGNLVITTFFFMAGLVMLEKGEGSLEARIVTPLRSAEYLLVKVLGLSALALAENLVIAGLFSGLRMALLPAALGLLSAAGLFTLAGFAAVIRYDSINEFLMPSMLYVVALMLPLADSFGLVHSPLFYLHPAQAALVLLEGAFRPLSLAEWVYGLGYSLVSLSVLFRLSQRALRRFVMGA